MSVNVQFPELIDNFEGLGHSSGSSTGGRTPLDLISLAKAIRNIERRIGTTEAKGDPNNHEARILGLTAISGSAIHEVASGTVDGVNKIFQSSQQYLESLIVVKVNGLEQLKNTHYTCIDPTTIQLDDAPQIGDVVSLSY